MPNVLIQMAPDTPTCPAHPNQLGNSEHVLPRLTGAPRLENGEHLLPGATGAPRPKKPHGEYTLRFLPGPARQFAPEPHYPFTPSSFRQSTGEAQHQFDSNSARSADDNVLYQPPASRPKMPPHQEASVEATLAALEALGGLLEGSGSTPALANAAFAAIAAPAAPMQLPADRADRAAPATGQRGVPVESGGHKVPERQEAAAATVTKMLVPDTIEVEEVPVTISRPITPAPKEGCLDDIQTGHQPGR